jgi:cell division septal protein FtsQ
LLADRNIYVASSEYSDIISTWTQQTQRQKQEIKMTTFTIGYYLNDGTTAKWSRKDTTLNAVLTEVTKYLKGRNWIVMSGGIQVASECA